MHALLLQALLLTAAPDASADHLTLTQDAAPVVHPSWGGAVTAIAGYPDGVGVRLGGWWRELALQGSVGTFLMGEGASAHVGWRHVFSDSRDARQMGFTWSGSVLGGVRYLHQLASFDSPAFKSLGPEAVVRVEGTRWMGSFGLLAAAQVGGMHLTLPSYFTQFPVLPTVSLELGVSF